MLNISNTANSIGSGVSGTQTGYTGGYLTLPAWTLSRWTSGSSADGTTLTALPDDGETCTARSDNQGSNCAEGNIITITGTITGLTGAWNNTTLVLASASNLAADVVTFTFVTGGFGDNTNFFEARATVSAGLETNCYIGIKAASEVETRGTITISNIVATITT